MPATDDVARAVVLRYRSQTHAGRRVVLLRGQSIPRLQLLPGAHRPADRENAGPPSGRLGGPMLGVEMAMVQVIENRTDVTGRVQSMRADPARPGYRIVTIEVHGTSPVEGYANMLGGAAGTTLEILVAADQ